MNEIEEGRYDLPFTAEQYKARATRAEALAARYRADVEKLREALEPFAEWLPCNHEQYGGRNTFEIEPEIDDLRNATRVLAETAPAETDGREG